MALCFGDSASWRAFQAERQRERSVAVRPCAVDAEIARLKTLHPDWQPPRDLFGAPAPHGSEDDTSGLWAACDRGDHGAVRSEINALRRINRAWQPPQKLLDLIAAAEVRAALKCRGAGRLGHCDRGRTARSAPDRADA